MYQYKTVLQRILMAFFVACFLFSLTAKAQTYIITTNPLSVSNNVFHFKFEYLNLSKRKSIGFYNFAFINSRPEDLKYKGYKISPFIRYYLDDLSAWNSAGDSINKSKRSKTVWVPYGQFKLTGSFFNSNVRYYRSKEHIDIKQDYFALGAGLSVGLQTRMSSGAVLDFCMGIQYLPQLVNMFYMKDTKQYEYNNHKFFSTNPWQSYGPGSVFEFRFGIGWGS